LTVDTVSGKTFTGHVAKIAPLPDAQVIWMNPDLKVYNTEIFVDGDGSKLRTGMSCSVKIIVEEYDDAIYVPIQAVLRVAGKPTVYVANRRKIVPQQVITGLDNNRMIRIIEGLDEGQEVLLAPPLAQAEMENAASSKNRQRRSEERNQSPSNDKPNRPTERRPRQEGRRGNLSPQQREKMRQQFENMSDEEKQKMRQQMQQQQGKTND
jgi:HlyD family secretion protein